MDEMTKPAASPNLPNSVRYVKNGVGGVWWRTARTNNQVHTGWSNIPHNLMRERRFAEIEKLVRAGYATGKQQPATADFNQLKTLLDNPSQHLWITFQDGYLWWCTVHDDVNDEPPGQNQGDFWLNCNRPWSSRFLGGRLLAASDLPGIITRTSGFRGTVCAPNSPEEILRRIHDQEDPDIIVAANDRQAYEASILTLIRKLHWKDFELLIDLILSRSGWSRIAKLGGTTEGVDIEAENASIDEVAFVQIKSEAGSSLLNEYVARFSDRRDRYQRMIFAVHKAKDNLVPPMDMPVQVWSGQKIASLVVKHGLGEWVSQRL